MMRNTIFRFGLIIAALLILFELSKVSAFVPEISSDIILALTGATFIGLGIYLGLKFRKEKVVEVPAPIEINSARIKELGLSEREMEVLHAMAEGESNSGIAEKLFVSESTIKTHVSNIFVKLDVKRRTQAVTKAKEIRIIQ